jgi:hypothetical protein
MPDLLARHDARRALRRRRGAAIGCLGLDLVLFGITAYGAQRAVAECSAYDAFRDAERAADAARSATATGDPAAVERQMDEADRLIRVGRAILAGVEALSSTGSGARGLLEAANYLEFLVGDYRSSGAVDFSITQFASRALTRAASGAGGAPLKSSAGNRRM